MFGQDFEKEESPLSYTNFQIMTDNSSANKRNKVYEKLEWEEALATKEDLKSIFELL